MVKKEGGNKSKAKNFIKTSLVALILIIVAVILFLLPIAFHSITTTSYLTTSLEYTTNTWVSKTFVISPGTYYAFCNMFTLKNPKLYINFEVTQGGYRDINLYIMSKNDYNNLVNHQSFGWYYKDPSTTADQITWYPQNTNEEICVVFDNTMSLITSKTIYITIEESGYR